MSGLDRVVRATVIAASILGSGCATTTAPPHWLPDAGSAQSEAFGGWIEIREKDQGSRSPSAGELITIDNDTLFVLTAAGLASISSHDVERAKLTRYSIPIEFLGLWTVLGAFSTISHGIGLIITAPFWIVAGASVTAVTSHAPQIAYPASAWEAFRPYSRFHDGWPAGFDRSTIRGKAVRLSPARSTKW